MRRIGLLGGSFNPAHEGHRAISLLALKRLGLHEVWWIVSPHNPLKDSQELGDFSVRFSHAEKIANHPRIKLTDIEARRGVRYTVDTVSYLKKRHPDCRFVWIMGADNLAGFHRWRRYTEIAKMLPILVIARLPYQPRALKGKAAGKLGFARRKSSILGRLSKARAPAWVFLREKSYPQSATAIRKMLGKRAFL